MVVDKDLCYLYKITHNTRPIIYIGLTNGPQARWASHKNSSSNKLLKHYMELYGSTEFTFSILEKDSRALIEELEELCIKELKDRGKNFIVCNVLEGSVSTGASSQIGEAHWNAKLTEDDIINIRNIYNNGGITQKKLGELYRISNKTVSKITCGDRWKRAAGAIISNNTTNRVANRRKLSDAAVIELRNLAYETFINTGSINMELFAKKYGVARQSIRAILVGKSYSKLAGFLLYKDYGTSKNGNG